MQSGYARTADNVYFYEEIVEDDKTGEMLYKCKIKNGFVYIPDDDLISSSCDITKLMDGFSVVDDTTGKIIETFNDWDRFIKFVINYEGTNQNKIIKFGEISVPKDYDGTSEFIRVVKFEPDYFEFLDY